MKTFILFCIGLFFLIPTNAQNALIETPPAYWDNFNIDEALKKAENGDSELQFRVALYYADVAPDNVKFKYWIEKSAAQNHSWAQYLIAKCYLFGDYGFMQNETKALEYLRKSAMSNNIEAIIAMYDNYRLGMCGVAKNDEQAAYWARKGALLGDALCQFFYGTMLQVGIGVLQNEQEGISWLKKSAEQKCIDAQCSLIVFYACQKDEESRRKLMMVGLDFLINPEISRNDESILMAKGLLGWEFCRRKNYKKGIPLMREGLKSQDELVQYQWDILNRYAQEVLKTTLYDLENQ